MTLPSAALKMDMTTKDAKAPPNTVIRGCRDAMMAAMRNVLSPAHVSGATMRLCKERDEKAVCDQHVPISETTIITKAWKKASGRQTRGPSTEATRAHTEGALVLDGGGHDAGVAWG